MPRLLAHLLLLAALALPSAPLAADDLPIVGTYTENTPCAGAAPDVMRVKITPKDIDSPILGLCTILETKRDASRSANAVTARAYGLDVSATEARAADRAIAVSATSASTRRRDALKRGVA